LAQKTRNKIASGKKTCSNCNKEKAYNQFYTATNPQASSGGGVVNICKTCVKKESIDSDGSLNVEKFKKMLSLMDKPYVEKAMNGAIDETRKAIETGAGRKDVIGNYFKAIGSLPQYTGVSFLQSLQMQEGGIIGEISPTPLLNNTNNGELIYSPAWRGNYTAEDIAYLDDYYARLNEDYKIITINHRDYARKIAKASFVMDRAYDEMLQNSTKDSENRYKAAKDVFDSLSKSAKFSEDKRSINDVGISSFSKITDLVEEHNWIPEHKPIAKDDIDRLLEYLSTITKSL